MYRVSVLIALAASLFLTWTILPSRAGLTPLSQTSPSLSFGKPTIKWQRGGCYSSWCETGWYSSPAVADLDGDGKPEVIGGLYTVFIVNGEDGSLQRAVDTSGSRVWPGVVVADINADGDLEIVTAQGGAVPKHLPSTISLDNGLGTVTQQILSAFDNGRGVFLPNLYRTKPWKDG